MEEFARIQRLPPYVFAVVVELKSNCDTPARTSSTWDGKPRSSHAEAHRRQARRGGPQPRNHRYSLSRGIPKLRLAICNWYKRKYNVELDPETEAIATIGAKEGCPTSCWRRWAPGHRVRTQPDIPDPCLLGGDRRRGRPVDLPHEREGTSSNAPRGRSRCCGRNRR